MELREEWNTVLNKSQDIYIYGAGKIGRKIFNLIRKSNQLVKLKGFVVSDDGRCNPTSIEDKPVILINSLNEKNSTILVSVSDIYQNEIIELLQKLGFTDIVCAYKYAFLNEGEIPQEIPESIMIDLRELLVQQYRGYEFGRYDIIVRLLAVKHYYKKNNFGFNFYRKMQDSRVYPGYSVIAEKRFKELINSVADCGYDEDSEIIVDKNLKLIDGSHRIALAIYYHIEKVRIRVLNKFEDIHYGLDWFRQYFGEAECEMLIDCERKVFKDCFHPIKGIIWSPVSNYFSEITELIDNQYGATNIIDYDFPKEIFVRFVHGVYHIDDIAEWKVKTKLEHFGDESSYHVRMLDINMSYPDFRIKRTGTTISREGEKLKKQIRDNYKNKVDNYFHDIIFHTADNYFQSEYMDLLVKKIFSLRQLFESIKDLEWMLIKTENNYFPKDFPDTYPAYKDIDMICKRDESKEILERIVSFYKKYAEHGYDVKVVLKEGKGFQVRLELCEFLIFQVDISYSIDCFKEKFLNISLSRRIQKDDYWIADIRDEILYRIVEAYKYPNKKRHLEYVKENIVNFDRTYFFENVNIQYKELLKGFIEKVY